MVITPQRNIVSRTWGTSVGKKSVIAVTGIVFLLYVIAHMIGNLKVFFGIETFDAYSQHLREIGEAIFGYEGVLWGIRAVLVGSVVLHMWAAFSLWYQAKKARPIGYQHRQRWEGSYAARTMRWGGVIIALFVIWHILDLTTGTVNPLGGDESAYLKLVASFDRWYVALFYILAVVALGLHIRHGLWSAIQTFGANSALKQNALKTFAFVVAAVITIGFAIVPLSVMTGLVR
ncbi:MULTISPECIES: succinate dehydrogenase cytochrome b subunit [Actinomycetospora]|uniref:succinate dehydrogenase cytochrome b subunit n=1 Tax=Actinomycetospora TaxID=402649 RepID=UPI002365012A|nr:MULTISPECIES: succinate dehydrogenase cytochrome b subunit [Actinomycetospora]MDD7917039.1 succinate dehydrogenase cytochrome b subunit [Actinomycetospora callitridis]